MSLTVLFIIGALIVAALIHSAKANKANPSSEQISGPTAQIPHIAADAGGSTITLDPEPLTSLPVSNIAAQVEVWNQTDFHVFVMQQGIRVTLRPQGRTQMDSRFFLTVTPASSDDALQFLSLQGNSTQSAPQYSLIVQGREK